MKHRTAVLAAVPSLTLLLLGPTACQPQYWGPSMCESSTPYGLGEEQAMRGAPIDYSRGVECSADDLDAFTASLEQGYRAGQQRYCDPYRVWAAGKEHGYDHQTPSFVPGHYAICSNGPALQAAYHAGHAAGLDELCQAGLFEEVGRQMGSKGTPGTFHPATFLMCGEARLQVMGEAFARGQQGGLASFCAPARWETLGHEAGNEGDAPADVRGSLGACPAEQHELIAAHYERGYQSGLARFCEPASWEPWAHRRGADGHHTPRVGDAIGRCSPVQQSGIMFHVQGGYQAGLRTYCDNSGIVNAAREAAREGNAPVLPDGYVVCLDVFPETQMIFASGYQTELTWMQQQWGSTPPMLPVRFQELVQHARTYGSREERLHVMKEAAAYNHFTSEQVRLLMLELSDEADRVEIAATLYPVVVDRIHWEQVYDTLYLHGQAALRERIAALP
jgi:hypothetical protein